MPAKIVLSVNSEVLSGQLVCQNSRIITYGCGPFIQKTSDYRPDLETALRVR